MFYDTSDLRDGEIFLKLTRTCGAQPEKRWLPGPSEKAGLLP